MRISIKNILHVQTRILRGDIHCTEEFQNDSEKIIEDTRTEKLRVKFRDDFVETSTMDPKEVADITFQGIKEEKLYIITP